MKNLDIITKERNDGDRYRDQIQFMHVSFLAYQKYRDRDKRQFMHVSFLVYLPFNIIKKIKKQTTDKFIKGKNVI